MVLMALGLALISGAPSSWLIDQMISHGVYEKRNQIFPKIQASIRFFAVIASIASYFLIDIENRLPIIIAGCISIIAGIFALAVGQDNYGEVKGNNILSTLHIHFKDFIKEKKLILLSLRTVICYVPFIAFVLFWQIYATEIIGLETKYLAFFLIIFMVLLMMGNYSVSILTKKISNFRISILGILISILGFALLFIFQSIPTFIIAAGLVELGFGVEQAATSTWMCDYIKSETRATYSSIFSTIQAVGGFVITNLLGLITESIGVNTAWIAAIVAMILDIFILIVFSSKYKHDKVI
jgi:predicted MFS family arabinose efflux permease